jgi:hypothetical protein
MATKARPTKPKQRFSDLSVRDQVEVVRVTESALGTLLLRSDGSPTVERAIEFTCATLQAELEQLTGLRLVEEPALVRAMDS